MRRPFLAHWLLCCVAAVVVFAASSSPGEQAFPYKAYVTTDDVYLRSGPGQAYYPTEKLKAGQVVEVYRHDPGGWCAIRPPKGSFTWVSTRYLDPSDDGLAQVNSPNVAARVGSRFSTIRDVIQVRLHQDEVVELLDEPRAGDDGWTRITPPSGEFRWVHAKYLDPEYPIDGIRRNEPVAQRPAPDSIRTTSWMSEEGVSAGNPSAQPRRFSPEEHQRRLEGLNLELSVMVAEEPTVWQFDEMALEAQHLVAQAETALQRGQARMLLGKIERFENIKQRYDTVEHVVADAGRQERRLAALEARGDAAMATGAPGRFDGAGRLTRVVSPKPGTPRYALVDEAGRVKCYVTPSPGMSLRHYEQRTVGVNGTRGYMPEQRAYHVMATHINLLDDGRMR